MSILSLLQKEKLLHSRGIKTDSTHFQKVSAAQQINLQTASRRLPVQTLMSWCDCRNLFGAGSVTERENWPDGELKHNSWQLLTSTLILRQPRQTDRYTTNTAKSSELLFKKKKKLQMLKHSWREEIQPLRYLHNIYHTLCYAALEKLPMCTMLLLQPPGVQLSAD